MQQKQDIFKVCENSSWEGLNMSELRKYIKEVNIYWIFY